MPYPYGVTGLTRRVNSTGDTELEVLHANVVNACSSDEAWGSVAKYIAEKYPSSYGWGATEFIVREYAREDLEVMLRVARPRNEIPQHLRMPVADLPQL